MPLGIIHHSLALQFVADRFYNKHLPGNLKFHKMDVRLVFILLSVTRLIKVNKTIKCKVHISAKEAETTCNKEAVM